MAREPRVLSREELIAKLTKAYPEMNCMLTEDFYSDSGNEGGIWLCGEDSILDRRGKELFSYYNDGSQYKFGVVNHLVNFLDRNGWFAEWYDAGTIMLWQK
jgi:hypothetical protein